TPLFRSLDTDTVPHNRVATAPLGPHGTVVLQRCHDPYRIVPQEGVTQPASPWVGLNVLRCQPLRVAGEVHEGKAGAVCHNNVLAGVHHVLFGDDDLTNPVVPAPPATERREA